MGTAASLTPSTSATPAIDVRALSSLSGSHPPLRDLTFAVAAGTLAAVIGVPGAGRTTLLKLIAGHLTPSGGRIRVCGIDLKSARLELTSRVGYVAERDPACGQMRVADLLEFSARAQQIDPRTLEPRLQSIIARCRLADLLQTPWDQLDSASHRQVALALALLHAPEVLLLDGFLDNVGATARPTLATIVRALRGHCTVLITGDSTLPRFVPADQVFRLDAGRLLTEAPSASHLAASLD